MELSSQECPLMDATSRSAPTEPEIAGPDADGGRTTRKLLVERRRMTPELALFVTATIVAGVTALAWATLTIPLGDGIATDGLSRIAADDRLTGLLFWIVIGLLGSFRTKGYDGRAVLTFHLPFIVAAMTLGGPVAGGWVAAIATIEVREIRDVPWFGTLSNHAIVALGGVLGGVVAVELRSALGPVVDPALATLVAAAGGAFTLCAVDIGLSATTVALRERLAFDELGAVYNASFRQTLGAEVLLGWLLAVVYVAIAWWAPIACFLLVTVIWRANDEHELTTHDAMTGLLNRRGFEARFDSTLRRVQRGQGLAAVVMIDLDKFKLVNDTHPLGHDAGDEVLRQVGRRVSGAIRYTDVAARRGGDEFEVLLSSVADGHAAWSVAKRIHERLCEPMLVGGEEVTIGASVGVTLLDEHSTKDALRQADLRMYEIKDRGGGVWMGAMA
jgi:diguanylate cyclase (GGDEF)-like protein